MQIAAGARTGGVTTGGITTSGGGKQIVKLLSGIEPLICKVLVKTVPQLSVDTSSFLLLLPVEVTVSI